MNAMTDSSTEKPEFHNGPHGKIAYRKSEGDGPGMIWLGGFRSDMEGSKAETLHQHAMETGQAFLRFDYSGHGMSEGKFEEGTISTWLADTLAVLDDLTDGPQILVGSSMGGWIALLVALARPARIAGMILIAPAPDFTETLMWAGFDQAARHTLITQGILKTPSDYSDEPDIITHALIEDGRNNLVLDKKIPVTGPVRILQGVQDPDVPFQHAIRVIDAVESEDVHMLLVKAGDHRLSTDDDLARLTNVASEVTKTIRSSGL